jgi:GNAT superfamily N-acetyltransferase
LEVAQDLLEQSCEYDNLLGLAHEKLFAPAAAGLGAEPLGAFLGETLIGVACTSGTWLRLLAVAPLHRCEGVGTKLLCASEAQIAAHGSQARTLDQPGNYLSPGIDVRNKASISWLKRREYQRVGSACNLLISLVQNPLVSDPKLKQVRARCAEEGYEILRMPARRLDAVAAVVETAFSKGWAFELRRAHTNSDGVHIAIESATGAFAGFAAHDGNNAGRGWFGPTGTLPEHRSRGLGKALLMACLIDVHRAGHAHCEVAWIGPREFYDKIAGIDSERHFTILRKELP